MKKFSAGLLLWTLLAAGCGKPSATDRDNRRLIECVLTAITLQNARLLEDDARWAAQRHEAGHLTDEHYQAIKAIIERARGGDWIAAEEAGYQFRQRHPIVKPGQ